MLLSFLKALASSICLILSLVTENCKPTSSKCVIGIHSNSKSHSKNSLSSLGVREAKIFVVDSLKLDWIAVSRG